MLVGISRSRFYRWQHDAARPEGVRAQQNGVLATLILLLFQAHHERPGRRPMQTLLDTAGMHASRGRIDRIMRRLGLQARRGRKYRMRRKSGPSAARFAQFQNRCLTPTGHRDFTSSQPGAKTVGDITHLRTADGPLYLATVTDLATRRVLGWSMAPVQDTRLAIEALRQARMRGLLLPTPVFHSDRGPQYTSDPFQQFCLQEGITQSMGATGVCFDNAVSESLFATIKGDQVSELSTTASAASVRAWVEAYLETWYNDRRPHTANAGLPPTAAWHQLCNAQATVSET